MDKFAARVEQQIRTAYQLVKNAQIAEADLQREAFKYALTALSEPQPATAPQATQPAAGTEPTDTMHANIAKALELPLEIIELIYDINGNQLALNLPTKVLPDSTSAAMREIAVLLTVGRKYAGIGASTPFELIRAACDELGKLDKKNFAVAMTGLKPRLTTTGKGAERELVAKRPADDLVREIVGRYGAVIG